MSQFYRVTTYGFYVQTTRIDGIERQKNKKASERRALEAAGSASALIPEGEIEEFEKPDFKIHTRSGVVGIEVTELMPPATSKQFSSRLAEKSFHENLMRIAEEEYNRASDAVRVGVATCFWPTNDGKYEIQVMARGLAEFVTRHRDQAKPVKTFSWRADLPAGFGVITICSTYDRPWYGKENIALTLEGIYQQFSQTIAKKNELVETYRANLPNCPIYLLIYSCAEVARGISITNRTDEWAFPFDFDRALFFSSLDNTVVEVLGAVPRSA
ncbi:MAG: hypothetical protein NVS9B4_27040 [Candidatus Acidiferrum sp.]